MNQHRSLDAYAGHLQQRLLRVQALLWCQQQRSAAVPIASGIKQGSADFHQAEFSAKTKLQLTELQLMLPCYQLSKNQPELLHVARPGWWQRLWHRPRYWQLCIQLSRDSIILTLTPSASPPWRRGHYHFSLQLEPAQIAALQQVAVQQQAAAQHQGKAGKGQQTQELV